MAMKSMLGLAQAEDITVSDAEIDAKIKEVSEGFSDTNRIDPARLRAAVAEDLLRDTLLEWLEQNASVTLVEAKPEEEQTASEDEKPKAKAKTKAKPKTKAKDADAKAATETPAD